MCPLALLAVSAAGAVPLVHDADPDAARATAEARLGPGDREPVALETLRAAAPSLMAGGRVEGCDDAAAGDAETLADDVQKALLFAEVDEAAALVTQARGAVLCAEDPPTPQLLARIELLAGVLAELRDDPEAARLRFDAAVAYDPQVAWIDAFPPERRVRFDAARQAEPPEAVALQVHPSRGVSIDGRPATERIPAGEHVVHVGGTGVRVVLEAGIPNTLVVPRAYPPDALGWMDDEPRRADLTRLLAAGVAEGVAAVVVDGDVAWTGTTGRVDWQAHRPAPVPSQIVPDPEPLPEPVVKKRSAAPPVLTGVGAAVATTGAVLAVTGASAARTAAEGARGLPSGPAYDDLKGDHRAAATRAVVGYGLLGAGGLCGGIGLVLAL